MAQIKSATQPIPFQPIVKHYQELVKTLYQNGMRVASDAAMKKANEIGTVLQEWAANPSAHTAGGFDALKRRIDSLMPSALTDDNANVARLVTSARNAVKETIIQNAPDYADVMKNYEQSISAQREIERALSLKKSNAADTALRKLQSITRNNVNTNYGGRVAGVKQLEAAGAPNIMPSLAGQALNSYLARGLVTPAMIAGGIAGGFINPAFLFGSLAASPRLVGEGAYLAGVSKRLAGKIPLPTRQNLLLSRGVGIAANPE
jgi:hypothetical protein